MPPNGSETVILCYSRTGHSARLARKLEDETGAHIVYLDVPAYKPGVFGFLRAAVHSLLKRNVAPRNAPDTKAYKRVILCGPVWTSYPATPLRAVLATLSDTQAQVAVMLTCGASGPGHKAVDVAAQDLGRPLLSTGVLANTEEGTPSETRIIQRFVARLSESDQLRVVG